MSEIQKLLAEVARADRASEPSIEVRSELSDVVRRRGPKKYRLWGAAAAAVAAVSLFILQPTKPQGTQPALAAPIQTSEFFVLDPVRPIEEMRSGRLVRVTLPADAPGYFGLPSGSRSGPVEADILLGDDGVARAVRFVH